MKIKVSELRNDRQWRSATGFDKKRFDTLYKPFEKSYRETYGRSLKERLVDNNVPYCIRNEKDLLLFTLFSLKSGLTYDLLGLVCGMDGSNAKRNQKIGLEILQKVLTDLNCMPKRKFSDVDEFKEHFSKSKHLIIDATEQVKQRPRDKDIQKIYYSGKKKPYRKIYDH